MLATMLWILTDASVGSIVLGEDMMMTPDDQSIPAFIAAALALDSDDDARWDAVWALQKRADDAVFAAAAGLIASDDARERELGVDILAQGQVAHKPLRERAIPLLLALAAREEAPPVTASLCYAFGHLHDPGTIDAVRAWVGHPDEDVRYAVVHGLSRYEDPRAIEALIQLSADVDSDVRDWATFGLGSQIATDTPAIRAALRARLDDPDVATCTEAVAGLAKRCEPGVLPALRVLFADTEASPLPLEAALALADPAYRGALTTLANAWERGEVLATVATSVEEALEACKPPGEGRNTGQA
jgi:HEAT repeat protein